MTTADFGGAPVQADVADYEAVDPATLDLPDAAQGELEGFLYPSTYEFGPDDTPEEQLRAMVGLGKQKYAEIGVPEDQLRDVIIKASIVQGEGLFAEDLPKIARVMENRLEGASETNGMMQMTISAESCCSQNISGC